MDSSHIKFRNKTWAKSKTRPTFETNETSNDDSVQYSAVIETKV